MNRLFAITLGVLTALGGFVDIGELVFNAQAGAIFQYQLLWVVAIAIVGGALFSEMSGRVAIASGRPVFDVVRARLGYRAGLVTLVSASIVNLLTLAAELGGMAIVLRLIAGTNYRLLLAVCTLLMLLVLARVPFDASEKLFSLLGLGLLTFVVVVWKLHPDWGAIAHGFVPSLPHHHPNSPPRHSWAVYGYFVVGLIGSGMTPYEMYFYSSGAIEDHWTRKDLSIDKITAMSGFVLGGGLAAAILVAASLTLSQHGVDPNFLGTTALVAQLNLGTVALLVAAVGMFFAMGGAAFEAAMSSAYCIAQFNGWEWGKYRGSLHAPKFVLTWLAFLVMAFLIGVTGVDPVKLTEAFVILAVFIMPLSYLPLLLAAGDRTFMGDYVNGALSRTLGWIFFALIVAMSIATVPLVVLSHMGQG